MKYNCVFISVFVCAFVTFDRTTAVKCPITRQPDGTFIKNLSDSGFCHFTDLSPRKAFENGVCGDGKLEPGQLNCCKTGDRTDADADCVSGCLGFGDSRYVDRTNDEYSISCLDRGQRKQTAVDIYEECTETEEPWESGSDPKYEKPCIFFDSNQFTLSNAIYLIQKLRNFMTPAFSEGSYKAAAKGFISRCIINLQWGTGVTRNAMEDVRISQGDPKTGVCSDIFLKPNGPTLGIHVWCYVDFERLRPHLVVEEK